MKAGFSQKQVAASLGVSAPTVSEWEGGKKNPKPEHLAQLADLLGVTTDYLLDREPTQRAESGMFEGIQFTDAEKQKLHAVFEAAINEILKERG